jgi:hypothetical protein
MKTAKEKSPLRHYYILLFLFMAAFQFGCNRKSDMSSRELIAGESSKTWRAVRETDASGDSERTSREDRKDVMQFYTNGTFTINTANEAGNGTWTYNDNNQTLSLQFTDANVTENFQVVELKEKEMRVKDGRNREMTLRAD